MRCGLRTALRTAMLLGVCGGLLAATPDVVRAQETLAQETLARETLGPPSPARPPHRAGPPIPASQPCRVGHPCSQTQMPRETDAEQERPRHEVPYEAPPAVITSGFGWRPDPFDASERDFHAGIDLAVPTGTPIFAPAAGDVLQAGAAEGYGLSVLVRSGRHVWRVAHLSVVAVQANTSVTAGTYLGRSGATGRVTGPHLHFEVRRAGAPISPGLFLEALARRRR